MTISPKPSFIITPFFKETVGDDAANRAKSCKVTINPHIEVECKKKRCTIKIEGSPGASLSGTPYQDTGYLASLPVFSNEPRRLGPFIEKLEYSIAPQENAVFVSADPSAPEERQFNLGRNEPNVTLNMGSFGGVNIGSNNNAHWVEREFTILTERNNQDVTWSKQIQFLNGRRYTPSDPASLINRGYIYNALDSIPMNSLKSSTLSTKATYELLSTDASFTVTARAHTVFIASVDNSSAWSDTLLFTRSIHEVVKSITAKNITGKPSYQYTLDKMVQIN